MAADAGRERKPSTLVSFVFHTVELGFVFKLCNEGNLLIECSVRTGMTLQAPTLF